MTRTRTHTAAETAVAIWQGISPSLWDGKLDTHTSATFGIIVRRIVAADTSAQTMRAIFAALNAAHGAKFARSAGHVVGRNDKGSRVVALFAELTAGDTNPVADGRLWIQALALDRRWQTPADVAAWFAADAELAEAERAASSFWDCAAGGGNPASGEGWARWAR